MKVATLQTLVELLTEKKGAKLVTIVTKTRPDFVRQAPDGRLNPFCGKNLKTDHNVFKISRVNGVVNWNYANAVNRQREREGVVEADFVAQPRKWGIRLAGLPFVVHTLTNGQTKVYLEVKPEHSLGYEFQDDKGQTIPTETVMPFLREHKQPETQQTDKEIILRDYDLGNILSITYGGETYVIEDNLQLVSDIAAVREVGR
jgi:hypothetical protein